MSVACSDGEYAVALIKNGVPLDIRAAQIRRIEYARALDSVSLASVEFVASSGACCAALGSADHWNTDLVIMDASSQEVFWRGPARRVHYERDTVRVDAQDFLAWAQVRIVRGPHKVERMDLSDIFIDLWDREVMAVDAPRAQIVRYASGVKQSRSIPASTNRRMWSIAQEMLDIGLDVTTFGEYIVVGMPPASPITLTDDDVLGSVAIVKDGDDYTNHVYSDVAKGIVGEYPAGLSGSFGYPLVELLLEDGSLQDAQSAQDAAKSRYDFSARGVRRVRADGGLVLLPQSNVDPRRLIAGQLVTFTASNTCYTATETLRLGRIGFVKESGRQTVTIELQPLGGVEGLADL